MPLAAMERKERNGCRHLFGRLADAAPPPVIKACRAPGSTAKIRQIRSGRAALNVLSLNIIGFKEFLARRNRRDGTAP
jgi:hypothetical protein